MNKNKLVKAVLYSLLLLPAVYCHGGSVALRSIGGRTCVQCEIVAGNQMMLATIVVDLGMYHPLYLDKDTCSALELQRDSRVTLSFPGVGKLENLTYQSPDLSHLKTFTKQYATELNEVPVLGIVGLPAFDNQPVMMDLGQGILEYGEVVRTGDDWRSLVWTQAESGGYRIAIRPAADYTLQAAFSTGSYETWINAICASIAGFPGGDFEQCDIGGLNLNAYTAVRPVASVPAGYPDAVIGNSFWQNFQVIIEPLSQTVWFRDKKAGLSDLKEQVFFKALIDEDVDAVEAYADAHPASRLAGEATETLLEWRFNEPVLDRESIERAVRRMAGTGSAREAAEKLIGYADSLFEKEQYDGDVIPLLLEQAKACTLKTTDALLLGYEAEGRMGRYAIFKKDWSNARLHLLAALFGQPNNPQFNYWMGQYYEANGQLTRAWSRYLKASMAEHAVSEAMAAIGRLNDDPAFRREFSMDDALDFLEGRVPIFNPADLPGGLGRAEVTLVESFTCADDAASVPLEMALQAAENVKSLIVMQYHLGMPAPEPLETSASQAAMKRCGVERAPALLVNGKRVDPEPVALLDAKQILEGVAAIPSPDTPRLLKIEAAALPAEERSWQIRVSADQLKDAGRCEIVLVERRCMLFSSTGIGMFRNVVRACLYDQTLSSPQEPVTTTFNLNQVQADVAAYTDAVQKTNNFNYLMVSSYIDAKMAFAAVKLYAPDGRLIAAGSQELATAGDNNGK